MAVMMMDKIRGIIIGYSEIFPNLREKVNSHYSHLMEFEEYLVALGMTIEPDEDNPRVQPDYRDIINKFKASLKTMQGSGIVCTLRKECHTYIQQRDGRQ